MRTSPVFTQVDLPQWKSESEQNLHVEQSIHTTMYTLEMQIH